MKKFPQIFDDIYTSTIFAGESSASLTEVFNDLASYLDKEAKVRAEVVGALVYPAILFFVSLAVSELKFSVKMHTVNIQNLK